jgi:hypothetical protein
MTFRVTVPSRPTLPSADAIRSGAPVRGVTWAAFAELYNWCLGQGTALVPMHTPRISTWSGAGDKYLSFRIQPRSYGLARIWALQLTSGRWRFRAPGAAAPIGDVLVPTDNVMTSPVMFVQTVAFPTDTAETVEVRIERISGGTGTLRRIGCYEVPRAFLETGFAYSDAEYGSLSESMTPQEQVYADPANRGNSIYAIDTAARAVGNQLHRGGLFAFTSEDDATAWEIPSGDGGLFFGSAPRPNPVLLAPKKRILNTVEQVQIGVIARCTDGTTSAGITFAMTSGASTTIFVGPATTSYTLHTGTINVHAEDVASADGRRASTWDVCAISGARIAGTGSCYVRNIGINHKFV